MTKEELIKKLNECAEMINEEASHFNADCFLIEYIDDKEIAEAYNKIEKYYS